MTVQAIEALAPLTIAAGNLATLVTKGQLLGASEAGSRLVLVSTLGALVAGTGQMVVIAKVTALGAGLGIERLHGSVIGTGKALVNTLVCSVE